MELNIIKQDVINELRNQRYFNEQEITRLITVETVSYKNRIDQIAFLVQTNVQLIESVKLMELYFPAAPEQVSPISTTPTVDQPQQ